MKYVVFIETTHHVEVDAENEEAAICSVTEQLDPRASGIVKVYVATDTIYDAATNTYRIEDVGNDQVEK